MRGPCSQTEAARAGSSPAAGDGAARGSEPARCSQPRQRAGQEPMHRMPAPRRETRSTRRRWRSSVARRAARRHRSDRDPCRPGSDKSDRGASDEGAGGCPTEWQWVGATAGTIPPAPVDAVATRLARASWRGSGRPQMSVAGADGRTSPAIPQNMQALCRGHRTSWLEPSDVEAERETDHLERRSQRKQEVAAKGRFIQRAQELRAHQPEVEVHARNNDGEHPDLCPLTGRELKEQRAGRLRRELVRRADHQGFPAQPQVASRYPPANRLQALMKWDIEEKTLNDVVEVLADPGVRASEARLAQRIKVGAAGGKPTEHGLQQPRRLDFALSGLRMDQPCEVETRHEEAGAPGENRQNRRL